LFERKNLNCRLGVEDGAGNKKKAGMKGDSQGDGWVENLSCQAEKRQVRQRTPCAVSSGGPAKQATPKEDRDLIEQGDHTIL